MTPPATDSPAAIRHWTPAIALGVIGAVHLAVGPLIYPAALRSIVAGGVAAAVEADPGLVALRASGFWYLTTGLCLVIVAVLLRSLERQEASLPRSAPWWLLGTACWGVVLMPASGFWAILAVAVWLLARDARARRDLPWVATAGTLGYGLGHAWWTATGPPAFVRVESVFVGGWLIVGIAGVAAIVGVGIGTRVTTRWPVALRWAWCGIGWVSAAALAAYCLALWPSLAQLLMIPFGSPVDENFQAALVLRASGTAAAVLLALSTRHEVRELRSACPDCGRRHDRPAAARESRTPSWGYVGGCLAVFGLAVRLVMGVIDWSTGFFSLQRAPGGYAFLIFIGLLVLAGSLLPLALVHRWGRIWPGWVPLVAGRQVPRWLVLGPGLAMAFGLLVYFGAGGLTMTILGHTSGEVGEAIEIGSYALWGLGLAIASLSYARLTQPPCRSGHGRVPPCGPHDHPGGGSPAAWRSTELTA